MDAQTFRLMVVPEPGSPLLGNSRTLVDINATLSAAIKALAPDAQVSNLIPRPRWAYTDSKGETLPGHAELPDAPVAPLGSYRITTRETANLHGRVEEWSAFLRDDPDIVSVLHSDVAVQSTWWADGQPFGTRSQARTLIGSDRLALTHATERVNVVIVDQGFDRSLFPDNFAGGWNEIAIDPTQTPVAIGPKPGQGSSQHAAGIARSVLDLAPNARLYDCPLIPVPAPGGRAALSDVAGFTLDAAAFWFTVLLDFLWPANGAALAGSWVFVNAWSIYDRTSDVGQFCYATDPDHSLNQVIRLMANTFRFDHVFAAGNCGQFAPDIRCGAADRGPCRSILGANSLDSVLTVGAVRTDATWLGVSSQGPGQTLLGTQKPDICAPSGFSEDDDRSAVQTGTSAAAGVAGGAIAALRAQWGRDVVSPSAMRQALRSTARPTIAPGYNVRTGFGILDVAAAASDLPQRVGN